MKKLSQTIAAAVTLVFVIGGVVGGTASARGFSEADREELLKSFPNYFGGAKVATDKPNSENRNASDGSGEQNEGED